MFPRMERKSAKGDLPKWSIALAETASVATFRLVRSGILCAKWITAARRFRLRAMSGALQRTDPRCKTLPISPEDAEALKQLNELLKHSGSKQN
jgi:hypothetical protein